MITSRFDFINKRTQILKTSIIFSKKVVFIMFIIGSLIIVCCEDRRVVIFVALSLMWSFSNFTVIQNMEASDHKSVNPRKILIKGVPG